MGLYRPALRGISGSQVPGLGNYGLPGQRAEQRSDRKGQIRMLQTGFDPMRKKQGM